MEIVTGYGAEARIVNKDVQRKLLSIYGSTALCRALAAFSVS
jgi:hypothetical protein